MLTLFFLVLESGYMVKGKELLKRIMAAHYKVDSASSISKLMIRIQMHQTRIDLDRIRIEMARIRV